ncbi:MAG: SusC/RagA family TonB-linked outer membrane protein [Tannerella sp.]|jgi:TonB-linked SusC/RagA family outer membrane protein|nr:SusC/RagA family TonB-linked outer membrane protein [Tannerella sp.]
MKRKIINLNFFLFAILLLNVVEIKAQDETDSLEYAGYVNIAFGKIAQEDLPGAVSSINIPELFKKNYYTNTTDGLRAFVGGYTGNIWGQEPLVLVDGVPLGTGAVNPSHIETITVLKSAGAVVLYGSRAAKGVILITTKRGEIKPLSIDLRANTGLYVPKRYPVYLNAAEYMALYNEASRNDGITERYDQSSIYNTAAGTNPYRYPDVNLYTSEYLKKVYNRSDVTMEVSGGNQRARYYSNFGMVYNNDLLNYGEQKNNNNLQVNVRSNVDMVITDWLRGSVDAGVIFEDIYRGRGDFWSTASTLRPNLFSPVIPINMLDVSNKSIADMIEDPSNRIVDGQYLYGGISTMQTNALADMLAGGYNKTKNRVFLFNVGLDADLGMWIKGLSFKTGYSVNYQSAYNENWSEQYAVYQPTWSNMNGSDVITGLTKYGVNRPSTNETISSAIYAQVMSFRGHFHYNRSFEQMHNFSGLLGAWGFQIHDASNLTNSSDVNSGSDYHRTSNANIGFQAAYNYRHKYYLDFSSAVTVSAKLPKSNRTAFSPTLTAGWRLSEEEFFNVSFVDNLKLTASYADLKQDIDIIDYYLYATDFNDRSPWYTRDIRGGVFGTSSRRGGNDNLTFVQRQEFRVGLETSLLNNFMMLDANYFLQYTTGLLSQGASSIFPSYFNSGIGNFLPYINNDKDKRTGVDFTLNLNKKIGQVDATLGFSGMYFTSKAIIRDEAYADDYQYREGKPLDAYFGYVCEGFFESADDIAAHARQTFGEVKPGDLKYKDLNGDNVIDSRDQKDLGRNGWAVPPFSYGVHLTLKWNNFSLFAFGTGNSGAIGFKDGNYYWVYGDRKYSEVVWGRWNEVTKNTATYPRLTTTGNTNNFRNSTFWMYKTNRFDLSKVQLTYDLPNQIFANTFIKNLSVYISGESLFTISKERKLMETNGSGAPYNRFFNLGFKTSF